MESKLAIPSTKRVQYFLLYGNSALLLLARVAIPIACKGCHSYALRQWQFSMLTRVTIACPHNYTPNPSGCDSRRFCSEAGCWHRVGAARILASF